MTKWALVTGATAGIGRAITDLLVNSEWNVVVTGRRQDRLAELQATYGDRVTSLSFDVSDRSSCERAFAEHKSVLSQVSVLVNNAGLARGVEAMPDANIDDWEQMIDTNIKGLLYMTRLCLPFIKKNKPGHIVNIGSVAGRWSYPGGGVYCGTKFAVRAMTEGLRMDLNGQDIRVTNISPGMVETEFSQVRLEDESKAEKVYQGMTPLEANDIAECVMWALQRPKHVNIQELVVFPTEQAAVGQVHRNEA